MARTYTYQPWPSWATGPNGEREIFPSEGAVPAGWTHHGETKKGRTAPAAPPAPPPAAPSAPDGVEVDSAGTPFDPSLHAATKTQTSKGLWRMKVGVARPGDSPPPPPAPPAPPPPA